MCREIADGNDYIDYLEGGGEPAIGNLGWINMHIWLIVIVVVACLMCAICGLSCIYNYLLLKYRRKPFYVPEFCPNCLFP
jgi:hypothetical protein